MKVTSYVDGITCFVLTFIGFIGGLFLGLYFGVRLINKDTDNDFNEVQSITQANDSIKLEIKHIDSLKNEKVIEVKGLSNDSTIKLFKRLVSE